MGCQEQASSPVEPEGLGPQFKHGGPPPHDPAGGRTFEVTVSGRFLSSETKSTTTVPEKPTLGVVAIGIDITFSEAFLDKFGFPDGRNCFKDQPMRGGLDVRQDKHDATKATGTFDFDAFDGTGEKEVGYTLTLSDGVIAGDWLPDVGDITIVSGSKGRMQGPGKAGRTCNTALFDIDYEISIERTE